MTTRSEIKKWVRPLLDWRHDLVLERDLLLLTPVRHVMRGVYFWPSRSKEYPKVGWFMVPLFEAPSPSTGFRFNNDIPVGNAEREDFQSVLETRVRHFIERVLAPIDAIGTFRDHTLVPRSWEDGGVSIRTLGRYPTEHAPVLAALGYLEEARAILGPALQEEEALFAEYLTVGNELLAKNPRSAIGKDRIRFAEYHLPILAELRTLLVALEGGDRTTIAALLHEWERENVEKWGVEHLWEPTPFPIELGS